jgi:hypothetical protein
VGPLLIFDKSALQSLNMDEAALFEVLLLPVMVPIFYVETLADLEKEMDVGRSAEDLVGMLAEKTPSNAAPNVHHRQLLLGNLIGQFEPTGSVVIGEGETKRDPDGVVGMEVGEFTEHTALLRWREGNFLDVERQVARRWRDELDAHNPTAVIEVLRDSLPDAGKVSDLAGLKEIIDAFCSSEAREVLQLALEVLDVPAEYRVAGLRRWEAQGRPPLDRFSTYLTHVFKVDLLFHLGMDRGFISGDRKSNRADMAYLYYLPCSMAFASFDNLHHRTVPLFLSERQSYVEGSDLKEALQELDEYYSALPEGIKALGLLEVASWPPAELDNAITRLWDRHMRPDWREIAADRQARMGEPRDTNSDAMTIEEFKERLQNSEVVGDEVMPGDGPGWMSIERRMPATKGKWRMVSKEVEEGGEAD